MLVAQPEQVLRTIPIPLPKRIRIIIIRPRSEGGVIVNSVLLDFVRAALARGLRRPEIARVLREAGWQEADIGRALDAFAELEFPLPIPKPQPYLSAREVFTYLVLFAALYVSALNLASLAFIFIDHYFPGPLQNHSLSAAADTIRWNVASLIVAFPLFLFTFRAINKAISEDPSKRGSRPRKWLVYLTLWVAVLVLTGDLSALIYKILGGELTIRFALKVTTVALIAGGVFAYFFWDIRKDEGLGSRLLNVRQKRGPDRWSPSKCVRLTSLAQSLALTQESPGFPGKGHAANEF
jgi:hypothetical protein